MRERRQEFSYSVLVAPYLSQGGMAGLRAAIAVSAQRGAWIRLITSDIEEKGFFSASRKFCSLPLQYSRGDAERDVPAFVADLEHAWSLREYSPHGSRGWNQRWLIYATQAGTRKHQVRLKSVKTVPRSKWHQSQVDCLNRSKWHQSQVDCLNLRSTGKGLIAEALPNFPQPRSWICAMNHTCQES